MLRRAGAFTLAAILLATAGAGPASRPWTPPSTLAQWLREAAPSSRPSTQPSDIARWLQAAASPEPDVREDARIQLQGLTPDDLPTLHEIAESQMPLKPAQADVLRQVVVYVVTRERMMREPASGKAVMGVMLSPFDLIGAAAEPDEKPTVGVEVISRLPGFAAARYLRDADVITGFEVDGKVHWFESRQQLQPFVSQLPVGKRVTVLVRRAGRDLKITFPLDAGRVAEGMNLGDPGRNLEGIAEDAEARAARQMEQDFGDVLGSGVD